MVSQAFKAPYACRLTCAALTRLDACASTVVCGCGFADARCVRDEIDIHQRNTQARTTGGTVAVDGAERRRPAQPFTARAEGVCQGGPHRPTQPVMPVHAPAVAPKLRKPQTLALHRLTPRQRSLSGRLFCKPAACRCLCTHSAPQRELEQRRACSLG